MLLAEELSQRINDGELDVDLEQMHAAEILDTLLGNLLAAKNTFRIFSREKTPIKGVYLWGGVGRGKSMLMSEFARIAAKRGLKVKKFHFHDFMIETHRQVHQNRETSMSDPTANVVARLIGHADLVCFDEMEVRDIADAMIIARVMEGFMRDGGVLVTTSNRQPDDLYEHGLQRERFLPFIASLKRHCQICHMREVTDWRQSRLAGLKGWFSPLGPATNQAIGEAFATLARGFTITPVSVTVTGRRIDIAEVAGGVAKICFDDLCARPLAAADYLALAGRFAGLVLTDIPTLGDATQNEARRFMWLVDAFYEKDRFLICSAETSIAEVYQGRQWQAEFPRTCSRLIQMARLPA